MSSLINRAKYEPYISRRAWTDEELIGIGFFDDGLVSDDNDSGHQLRTVLDDYRWVTPTAHLASSGVVLCMTGAFSPFHAGHLRALEIAKQELESRGVHVAGALVQPDHDGYVSIKRDGTAACIAAVRIHHAQEATKHVPWIAVDPWASIYQDRALNYTTILWRTQQYLGPKYKAVCVFGSDNGGFKPAFLADEYVCVGRPGYESPHPNALPLSSTSIRAAAALVRGASPSEAVPYIIRNDLSWATSDWANCEEAVSQFANDLTHAYLKAFGLPPTWYHIPNTYTGPHISFDRITGATHWVSRVFNPCTHQHHPVDWISSGLQNIPAGKYALVDDDIASGTTVSYIKKNTPQVNWTETVSLLRMVNHGSVFDIVDGRDFLFGSKLGGLCVKDAGEIFRAPYIAPWVNLTQRAKIPPIKQTEFVNDVIRANINFFKTVSVTVSNTDNAAFWIRLGYASHTPMLDVSRDLLKWRNN